MASIQQLAKPRVILSLLLLGLSSLAQAQTSLNLASASAPPGGSVSLNLALAATTAPAGLQWTFSYSAGDVASLGVAAGPALTAAGKTLTCNAVTGSATCLAVGMNSNTIGNATVAVVTVTLASTSSSSVPISIGNMAGVLPDGTAATVSGTGGAISVQASNPAPSITSLAPSTAIAGGAAFNLTVNGSGFVSGSVVNWNGAVRTTSLISPTQLQAAISATDIATAGTAQVTVTSPAPGGGTTGNSAFSINNPAPSITSLAPSSVTAGGGAFNLTVNGSGFISASAVNWNGSPRTTTWVSGTQLQAAITATDIATAGTAQVTVTSPAPGGGVSGNFGFTVNNPAPSIISLAPSGAIAGGAAFTLTVNGNGFISASVVNWNGSPRTTTLVSATQLQAAITAADIATAGTAQVTVTNPAPGAATTAYSPFSINNPAPSVTSLVPSGATAGGGAFTLTVNGSGFMAGSMVNWNGSARTTTFVSATQLHAAIAATDIAAEGTAAVTVFNPAPGGGTSGNSAFNVNNPGLTGAYGMNEGTGSTIADTSGNGNTGQIQGAAWTTAGKYGNALSFNGSGSYVDLGNPPSMQTIGSMTWSAWVYITGNPPKDAQIVARSNGTAGWALETSSDTGARTFAIAMASNDNGQTHRYSKTKPTSNTWYYVAGVYNAASRSLDIYVNGVLDDGTLNGKVPKSQSLVSVNTTIGKSGGGEYFNGVIDEMRIYTTAISQSEIQSDMNTPINRSLTTNTLTRMAVPATIAKSGSHAPASPPAAATRPAGKPAAAVSGLSCSPRTVNAGGVATCELRMTASPVPLELQFASSSDQVKIPAAAVSRPNQPSLTFQASIEPAAKQQPAVITVALGDSVAQDTILVTPAVRPVLRAPDRLAAKYGDLLTFSVTASDPYDLPLQLAASGIPEGAWFDPAIGRFEWTPGASQTGTYHVAFTATNPAHQSSTAQVTIEVDSGSPVLTASERFACSPGSVADLTGKWLATPGAMLRDPSGISLDLGGTRVKVNGQYAPVLASSGTLVKFLCPDLDAGTQINVAVETTSATSNHLTAIMQKATPQILTLEGSATDQGMISFVGTTDIAMDRNFRIPAHPAQPGDQILIWATGLGSAAVGSRAVSVKLAGVYAQVDSIQAVSGFAGMYTIQVRMPDAAISSGAVPVQLEVATPDGHWFNSNRVTLAIEPVSQ